MGHFFQEETMTPQVTSQENCDCFMGVKLLRRHRGKRDLGSVWEEGGELELPVFSLPSSVLSSKLTFFVGSSKIMSPKLFHLHHGSIQYLSAMLCYNLSRVCCRKLNINYCRITLFMLTFILCSTYVLLVTCELSRPESFENSV